LGDPHLGLGRLKIFKSIFTPAEMAVISQPFSALGSSKAKFLFLGSPADLPGPLAESIRSLNLEHIYGDAFGSVPTARRETARRWFWSRKSGRGFALFGFPADLAESLALDEWLETRGESLAACVLLGDSSLFPSALRQVADRYFDQGLLCRPEALAA
jgi:hypothetical protein